MNRLHGTVYEYRATASPRSSQSSTFKLRAFVRDKFAHDCKQPSNIAKSNFPRQRSNCEPALPTSCTEPVRSVSGRSTRKLHLRCRSFTCSADPICHRLCNVRFFPFPATNPSVSMMLTKSSGQDPYNSSAYGVGYPQMPGSYLPPQSSGYGTHYAISSSGQTAVQLSTEDPSGVRVVTARPKPQCWEHGCNGRQFSTFSNLLRHQREKSGTAAKSECPRCGAVFTRTTARNGHLAHDKCKRKSTASASEIDQ